MAGEETEQQQAAQESSTGQEGNEGKDFDHFRLNPETGNIQIRTEEQSGPEVGPDEGQPSRGSHEETQGEAGTRQEAGNREQETEPETGEGKSSGSDFETLSDEQKSRQYENLESLVGKLGNEIGELRKELSGRDKSPEELYDDMSSRELTDALAETESEVEELEASEDADPEELKQKKAMRNKIKADIVSKRAEEAIDQQMSSQRNAEFQQEMREHFEEQGIEIDDEEFSEITEQAKNYARNGQLNEAAYHHAMIDKYGVDKMRKVDQMNAEEKTRKEIRDAEKKSGDRIHAGGSGKDTGWKDLGSLGIQELEAELDKMDRETISQMRKEADRLAGA